MNKKSSSSLISSVKYNQNDHQIIVLGLLAEASTCPRGEVSVDTLEKQLRCRGIDVSSDEMRSEVDSLLRSHCWFGLAWADTACTKLSTIAGVRWFCQSSMYETLVSTKPKFRRLTELFADQAQELEKRYTNPRLLIDAGATAFHCLFHDRCQRLRRQAKSLLTSNLFVAFRWQEEFNDQGKIHLIGGVPNLDMAATVDNEKLMQWLRAKSRRPDVSLLSWHFVKPEPDGTVTLWTKNHREYEMKKAAMELTEGTIYIVWSKEKITSQVPKGGRCYSIEKLLSNQKKKQQREVFFITDIVKPSSEQQKVLDYLSQKKFAKNRMWLVCPHTNTCS